MNPLGLSLGETLKRDSWREMVKLSREGTEDKKLKRIRELLAWHSLSRSFWC